MVIRIGDLRRDGFHFHTTVEGWPDALRWFDGCEPCRIQLVYGVVLVLRGTTATKGKV